MPLSPYSNLSNNDLELVDFKRFSDQFSKILLEYIPTAQKVEFFFYNPHQKPETIDPVIAGVIEKLHGSEDPFGLVLDSFYLQFAVNHYQVIAAVHEVDEVVLQRYERNWLGEVWTKSLQSWQGLRRLYVDPGTGLLNQNSLRMELQGTDLEDHGLLLIDLPQGTKNSLHLFDALATKARILGSLPLGPCKMYYFGASIFALLLPFSGDLAPWGEKILGLLRKEGVEQVHLGMCSCSSSSSLESAFIALDEACRRGPYSFCDYLTLGETYIHPLAEMPERVEKCLLAESRKYKQFSLILFEQENGSGVHFKDTILGDKQTIIEGGRCYLLLADMEATAAHAFALKVIEDMAKLGASCSGGVSFYPHRDFTKRAVLSQAQKALCHTKFYGPSTATIFDSTSLNVSGDIYYSEGNYVKACKEYRVGCKVDPENINILNSLGVSLAMMGKAEALKCFDKVLVLDSDNFMALYNKGLHYLSGNKRQLAAQAFEKAKELIEGTASELRSDLESRLGVLYALEGKPKKSLELLLPYAESSEGKYQQLAYYVGKNLFKLKKYKEAGGWLQKANSLMATSAEVYSLLGYVYFKTKQGEASLSLSRKAVALDGSQPIYKLRLSEVLFAYGHQEQAIALCRKLLRLKPTKEKARILLGGFYAQQGQISKSIRLRRK